MYKQIIPCPICDGFVTVASDHYICDKCGPGPSRAPYSNVKETRKEDREIMLRAMQRLCEKFGVPYEIDRAFLGSARAVAIGIRGPTGLALTVDFDGNSCQPDVFVLSWHMMTDSRFDNTIIRSDFAQSHNEYHKRKATDVFRGFESLIRVMSIRLQRIADGTATEEGEPAKRIPWVPLPSGFKAEAAGHDLATQIIEELQSEARPSVGTLQWVPD